MSVIAVKGIPSIISLIDVVKKVGKQVAGPFEPLNFDVPRNNVKTCYLRLSERLDPVQVVERINSANIAIKNCRLNAYVPDSVPDLPLPEKRRKIPLRVLNSLKIPVLELPHEVITDTHYELFRELQYKYPGLYNISRKTSHKLLDEISRTIGERLTQLMDASPDTRDSSFRLSKCYRVRYPHSGDLQLVLGTLHALQDAAAAPRAPLTEQDLLSHVHAQSIDNVPMDRIQAVCNKHCKRVCASFRQYVQGLDTEIRQNDSEEDIARKKVREELKKMIPYLHTTLKQVISTHFIPEEQPYRRIRIYGEPFLPSREAMEPFIRRYAATRGRARRSRRMYNLLAFKVAAHMYAPLRAMDATVLNGAKLIIRCADIPLHAVDPSLRAELAAHYGGTPSAIDDHYDDEDYEEEENDEE